MSSTRLDNRSSPRLPALAFFCISKAMAEQQQLPAPVVKDFDLVTIPMEGVVAYWLSLRKLLGNTRRMAKVTTDEAQYTTEPFIRYLLEIAFEDLDDAWLERAAAAKRRTLQRQLRRRLDLMRLALLDIASGEHPRKTMVKMAAKYATPPITDERAFRLVQELASAAEQNPGGKANYFNVEYRLRDEQLVVVLLFYVLWARKAGKRSLAEFQEFVTAGFFAEGLDLVVDGFDVPFIRKRMRAHRDAILEDVDHKRDACYELCCAVRSRLDYDRAFLLGKSFLE